jgi:hypothetical protein
LHHGCYSCPLVILLQWTTTYNNHGHKLRFPPSKKAQFVTECGIPGNPPVIIAP